MAEEIDESTFYRQDFSTESDAEVYQSQLAEIFQKWELTSNDWGRHFEKDELFTCKWHVQTETLIILKIEMSVSYYTAQLKNFELSESVSNDDQMPPMHQDLMALQNTFAPPLVGQGNDLHALARLYGLRRFVVMHPSNMQTQFLTNPAEFSFFLSSAAVVAAEVGSAVPIFVQIYNPKWNFYVGVGIAPSLRTNFDLVALEQAPMDYRYLSGLLTMFKQKLPSTYLRQATVSVRNTYTLDTVSVRVPMCVPFSKSPVFDEEGGSSDGAMLSNSQFIALPCGYFPDSCMERYAVYTWPEIAESIAMDSALRTDFVPSKAPFGNIHQAVHATSYLTSCVRDYQKLNNATQTLEYFVGRNFTGTGSAAEVANPLDQLTKPHLRHIRSRHNYLKNLQTPQKKLPGPMNDNEVNQMLFYLFPEIHPDAALFPYNDKLYKKEFDLHRIKSAGSDSLVSRLSCLLATCHAHFGGKSGLAQLWATFTRELRFLWDYNLMIPGVATGFPDMRTCLLHQKLQMLNVCIQRRKLREQGGKPDDIKPTVEGATGDGGDAIDAPDKNVLAKSGSTDGDAQSDADADDNDEDNDEFYDCANYEEPSGDAASGVHKPEGRQKRLSEMKLLGSDEPLYVPITQEPVPKTEDQLHDDAETMMKLGPDLTTQMMCSSLLSDMEAFKAANPLCQIEDFIRWYSPKDWEEMPGDDGEAVGKLSARMQHPDNTWQTVWKQARHVPAWRQKRLFDDTNEALKVLQYLETRTIGEIYELTMIPMLHSAILKLKDIFTNAQVFDIFSEQIDFVLADLCRLSRDIEIVSQTDTGFTTQMPDPESVIRGIETLETQFYQFKCLQRSCGYPHCTRIDEVKQQFKEVLKNGGSCKIINRSRDGAAEGDGGMSDGVGMINPSFKNEMRDNLISKDYVIRLDGETTALTKGQTGSQFLRAIVTGEKLRLCSAFTENTTFI